MQTSASQHQIGDLIPGGYRVIKVLRGGMGVVYISHQAATEQLYALKTVRIDAAEDEVAARFEKFRDEANRWIQISRESRCEHIVRALSFDADDQLLILEFIDGLALSDICYKGPVHHDAALRWARHIAEGMREIHTRFRLLHRDLKPSNVLVTRRGLVAKITDFGIVKAVRPNEVGGTISGTPGFMAPECLEGVVDFRSDVYSYGATLAACLSGERRPRTDELVRTLAGFDRKVVGLIERCMAANPGRRPQSFDDVLSELSDIEPDQFARDGQSFQRCEPHRFHSTGACGFCVQEKDLNERLLNGQLVVRAGTDATLTLVDASASGGRRSRRATPPAARLAAVAVVVLAAGLGVKMVSQWWGGGGPDRNPNPGAGAAAGSRCQEPGGCDKAILDANAAAVNQVRAQAGLAPWTPQFCKTHTPFVCTGCAMRHRQRASSDALCECGGKIEPDPP